MAVIDDPRTTATKLEKAIALDQALTAKVLRIANSPFYGAVRDIKTVSEAVVRLGFVTIRNWTLVAATKSIFLTPGSGMLFQKIWRQSVLSALASQLVAQVVPRCEPETAFLGGLMQNIGQLVLAKAEPELFHHIIEESASNQLPYHEVERQLLGFDHGELGSLLIREWNLSPELEVAVCHHHRLTECEDPSLPAVIALGEELAACSSSAQEAVSQNYQESAAARILEISAEEFNRLQEQSHHLSIDPLFFS
jgi:HD-like signal output (HDOD) protein